MTITYHDNLIQGSDEWLAARCGLLTGSEFDRILTPTGKIADNPKSRAHCWEIAAQRISGFVEPHYVSDAMLRGREDEILARAAYSKRFTPVREVGFVTRDMGGFTLGCSPDGLVGEDGMIECKSRGQKFQVQTIVEYHEDGTVPADYILQIQGNMLITGRKWCDFISYSGGLPMATMRVMADAKVQASIIEAASKFEDSISKIVADYRAALDANPDLIPTERRVEQDMFV